VWTSTAAVSASKAGVAARAGAASAGVIRPLKPPARWEPAGLPGEHDAGVVIFEARAKWVRRALERAAPATAYPFSSIRRPIAERAARTPAGLERGGDLSAGRPGGRAADAERSEPP